MPRLIPSFDHLVDDLALFALQLRSHYTVQQKVCADDMSPCSLLWRLLASEGLAAYLWSPAPQVKRLLP